MTTDERELLLNIKIDATTTIRDAMATQFMRWCLNKVNGLQMFDKTVGEITSLATTYPGRYMDDGKKLELIVKLQALGINLEI
jgi:hypothetical protein